MMKNLVRYGILIGLAMNLAFASEGDGGTSSGGGHGVQAADGTLHFLDAVVTDDEGGQEELNLFEHELTSVAAQRVLTVIRELGKLYPGFAAALETRFAKMEWRLSNFPLEPIRDAELRPPYDQYALLQLMRQEQPEDSDRCAVVIDRTLLEKTSQIARERMILHELLLCKLGLTTPRAVLRLAGKALHARDWSGLRSQLDSLSPSILEGKYELAIEYGALGDTRPILSGLVEVNGQAASSLKFQAQPRWAAAENANLVVKTYVLGAEANRLRLKLMAFRDNPYRESSDLLYGVKVNGVVLFRVKHRIRNGAIAQKIEAPLYLR